MAHVLVFSDLPLARQIALARVARDWRLSDVATYATAWCVEHKWAKRVQPADVGELERGGCVTPIKRRAILAVLGLDDDVEEARP